MYRVAEEFFVSMNMSAMPPEFWSKSVFEEVPGRPVICQPSAWDFCNGLDYRFVSIFNENDFQNSDRSFPSSKLVEICIKVESLYFEI